MIVLDASAAVDLLLELQAGVGVAARIRSEAEIFAPHLIDLEVTHALRRLEQRRVITEERAELALLDLEALGLQRRPHDVLLPRIWELRANATSYDAAYLVLAEVLDAPLVTTDGKLARVAGCRARVEVIQ